MGLFLLLLIITSVYFVFGKENIGFFFDRLGLTRNSYYCEIGKSVYKDSLYIYWAAEEAERDRTDNLLIYHKGFKFDIPPTYGDNRILIKYKNHLYQ